MAAPKSAVKSKTIIGNVIIIALFILSQFVDVSEDEKNTIIAFITSPETQVFIATFYNIIMRFFTKKPVVL